MQKLFFKSDERMEHVALSLLIYSVISYAMRNNGVAKDGTKITVTKCSESHVNETITILSVVSQCIILFVYFCFLWTFLSVFLYSTSSSRTTRLTAYSTMYFVRVDMAKRKTSINGDGDRENDRNGEWERTHQNSMHKTCNDSIQFSVHSIRFITNDKYNNNDNNNNEMKTIARDPFADASILAGLVAATAAVAMAGWMLLFVVLMWLLAYESYASNSQPKHHTRTEHTKSVSTKTPKHRQKITITPKHTQKNEESRLMQPIQTRLGRS